MRGSWGGGGGSRLRTNLDHDELLLLGPSVGPVLPKAEEDLEGGRFWSFTLLELDQSWGRSFRSVPEQSCWTWTRSSALTFQEAVEAEDSDPLLSFQGVGQTLGRNRRSRPEHLALAEPDGVDVLLPDLQDQAPLHHRQHRLCVEPLLLVLDVRGSWELDLLQGDGSQQVHLVRAGLQLAVVEAAALRVADGVGAHHLAPVLDPQLQICNYSSTRTRTQTQTLKGPSDTGQLTQNQCVDSRGMLFSRSYLTGCWF